MKTRRERPVIPKISQERENSSVSIDPPRVGTILVLADGSVPACDPVSEAILGISRERMSDWIDLVPPWRATREDGSPASGAEHPARLALKDGNPRENEILNLSKPNGDRIWLSIDARPLFSSPGTPPHAVTLSLWEIDRQDPLAALRDSNAILDTTDKDTAVLVFAKDRRGRIVKVNPATLRLLQKTEAEIVGKTDIEYLGDREHAERIMENDRHVLEAGQILVCEENVTGENGEERTYLSIKMPYRDHTGKIIGMVGVSTDITERERIERQLRETNERLTTILERMTDAFITLDRDWRIIYANRETARLNNMPVEEIVGKTHWEMWPWSVGTVVERNYRQAAIEGRPIHFEVLYEPLSMWLEVHAYPSETGMGIFFRDITERKEVEEALQASEEKFRRMAEAIPDVFWITDFTHRHVQYVSPAYESIWGRSADRLLEDIDLWSESIHPDDRAIVLTAAENCLQRGSQTAEYRIVRPDGSIRWIRDRGFAIQEEDGSVFRVAGIAEDITERHQQEQAARERESLLRLALKSASAGAWSWDLVTGKSVWSEEYYLLYGLDPETTSPSYETWLQCVEPLDRAESDRVVRESIETGELNVRFRVLHPEGRRWFQARGQTLHDARGRPILAIGITQDITVAQRLEEERELAETALRRSEAKFRRLVEANMFGVSVSDTTGRLLDANDALLRLLGYTREELEAGQIFPKDLTPLEPNGRAREELRETGVCQPREKEYLHKDGHRIPVLIGSALLDGLAEPGARILSFYIDLSELKRTETALREQRLLLETILKQAADAVIVCDRAGKLTFINATARRLAGRDPSAIDLDLDLADWGNAYDTEGNPVAIEDHALYKALRGEVSLSIESRLARPDGSYYDILTSAAPLRGGDNEIVGAVATFMDITERVRSAEVLRETAESLALSLSAARMGYWNWDAATDTVTFSERAAEIFGIPSGGPYLTWTEIRQLLYEGDRERAKEGVERSIRERGDYDIEYRVIRPRDGAECWVSAKGRARYDSAGQPTGMIGVVQDISDRKRAESRLQQQAKDLEDLNASLEEATAGLTRRNQELDRFVYAVSHDLKAPLRAIANLSEWIEEDLADRLTEDGRYQMELLRGRVQRMIHLIDGLLEYSRVGRWTVETEPVSIAALLAEIIDSIAPPPTFTITIADPMPTPLTKRLPLRQVFANLIGNAIKHHDRPDGHIEISARDLGDRYEFSVRDDGPGIAPEHHDRIFGIFQTLKSVDNAESTGIGLTIVQKILDTEGGSIALESDIGKGATFRFTWPVS
ncbi:PAS domain S-box protein [Pannus brasiliensis CCIBt3594]|uniref:histidine kinase n=1 Tax=Pannus brasiliensis CCIBt3594 TaxID=1427578 RepID=A0AAW9QZB0_9CHRO